jgi:hypothetical protein
MLLKTWQLEVIFDPKIERRVVLFFLRQLAWCGDPEVNYWRCGHAHSFFTTNWKARLSIATCARNESSELG